MYQNQTTIEDLSGYDFLDFGASKGGSIEFARRRLGGDSGVGIDIDPHKVGLMSQAGYDCLQADVTALGFPPACVRFVVMSHFLEHLPSLDVVRQAVRRAATVACDHLFIQGPYFDADEHLRQYGLKFYWSDWRGHPCHLTTGDLQEILIGLGLTDYVMMGNGKVDDSLDSAIHPLNSPPDQHAYDPQIHPAKPLVTFRQPLFREMVCCVRLRDIDYWDDVLRARKGCVRLGGDG